MRKAPRPPIKATAMSRCKNCADIQCMACVLRQPHKTCELDCPECKTPPLFDIEVTERTLNVERY